MGGFYNVVTGGASTITSANAIVTITVPGLFDTPVQLEGFSVDKAWDTASVVRNESQIGVDGRKTAGRVFNPIKQTFSFQADPPSVAIFEVIDAAGRLVNDVYYIYANITLPSTTQSYLCVKGTLEDMNPMASAGKVLSAREFSISWADILPA